MLCIIFTKKRLLAGLKTEIPQLLSIGGKSHISFEGRAMHEVLHSHLDEITTSYTKVLKDTGKDTSGPFQASLAFPVDIAQKDQQKNQIFNVLREAKPIAYDPIHSENLALSFLYGLKNQDHLTDQNCIVLESIDDYLNLCYHTHVAGEDVDIKEFGALALHTDEAFKYQAYRQIGYSKGNEQILNELLKEFSEAGLTVDVKGQTDLALQLLAPNPDQKYLYSLSKSTQHVNIQAEIELSRARFSELMAWNKEKLADALSQEKLRRDEIKKIVLLGTYLKNPSLRAYLTDTLQLRDQIISMDGGSEYDEFATIVEGMTFRTQEVLDAEQLRLEEEARKKKEEEKRAKIHAELKVKDSRESLLAELQEACVDPSKQEEYEEQFVNRGIKLGIPDVVIKWNISEVLGRIALTKEVESVGLTTEEKETPKPSLPTPATETPKPSLPTNGNGSASVSDKHENGHVSASKVVKPITPQESTTPAMGFANLSKEPQNVGTIVAPTPTEVKKEILEKEEIKPEIKELEQAKEKVEEPAKNKVEEQKPVLDKTAAEKVAKEEEKAKASELVKEAPKKEEAKKKEVVAKEKEKPVEEKKAAEKVETKSEETEKSAKTTKVEEKKTDKKKGTEESPKISLNDIFVIKGSLPDAEFSSKKVTFHSDQELKVVRLLSTKDQDHEEKTAKFKHLYEKELKYYDEMSELSASKEGLYYYRPFIEPHTLKDQVIKLGLNKKKNLDDLSSADLKFILQIFKEVRELKVSHANLTAENILIVAKRKWNLQKNMEVKFIGFTSEEVSNKDMIEQTHNIFAELMGKELYQVFRQKFQL